MKLIKLLVVIPAQMYKLSYIILHYVVFYYIMLYYMTICYIT